MSVKKFYKDGDLVDLKVQTATIETQLNEYK